MNQIDFLDEIGNYIFTSKYARYDERKKRRETFSEAVARVEKMHLKRFPQLSEEDKDEIQWAFDQVRNKVVAPSMRSLQFGGKAVENKHQKIFNCFDKETSFITDEGVKKFSDFKDGDTVFVLTHKGNWKEAIVKSYGEQDLYEIVFSKGKHEIHKVLATKDHRWILNNGETTQLKEGDLIGSIPNILEEFDYEDSYPDERLYWCYGYVYGDGTVIKDKNKNPIASMVRICKKDKERKFADRFEEMGFSTSSPLSCQGDIMAYTGSYLKKCPDPKIDSPRLIRAFVRGYLDADGEKNTSYKGKGNPSKFITIQSSEQEHIDFIRNCFPIAGSYIVSETDLTGQVTNFGTRPYTILFRICDSQTSQSQNRVKKISEIPIKKDNVWCLEVEDDESFVFPNGIITGNCSVRHIDSLRSFAEIFHLALNGCGVGIGLSQKYLNRLPDLVDKSDKTGTVITYVVEDTIEGWSNSVEALLMCYFKNTPYTGYKIVFDFSRIRPAGTPLKTTGGKAPGHLGLKNSLQKVKILLDHIIEDLKLKRIRSIDAFDILMHCADAVLSGGIRRAAMSTVFDIDDNLMMEAKTYLKVDSYRRFSKDEDTGNYHGEVFVQGKKHNVSISEYEYNKLLVDENKINWFHIEPQRARSNNSVLLGRKTTTREQFKEIIEKTRQFGEPGFVFANDEVLEDVLFNPCFEIGFLPVSDDGQAGVQFCNLTTMNGARIDSLDKFRDATKAATIIGTLQSSYTDFRFLSNMAKNLTEEESLLGVSITGMMDNPDVLLNPEYQREMSALACFTNEVWAKKLGINPSARITCIKPEGTSSLVLGSASGIHPHHARRYFRRVQNNKLDNVYNHFKSVNPHATEESTYSANKTDDIITFPIEISESAMVKKDLTALKHLDIIRSTQENWVLPGTTKYNKKNITHNTSCFDGSEKFYSNYGLISFDESISLKDIKVLNRNGDFVNATVNSFDPQEIFKLNLVCGKLTKQILTTANHNWPVTSNKNRFLKKKDKIKQTVSLVKGDQLNNIFSNFSGKINLEAVAHGIVFGDGSKHYEKESNKTFIYLCDKSRELKDVFVKLGYKAIEKNDINQTHIYSLPSNWKDLPVELDEEYLFGFIAGWFAADGHVSSTGRDYTICSVNKENLLWLQKYACIAKIGISFKILQHSFSKNNLFNKSEFFYTLSFKKESLNEDFFILSYKKDRYVKSSKKQSCKHWKVKSVEATGEIKKVYCVEEPIDHEFVLEGNILTKNCTVQVADEEWEDVINYLYDNREFFAAVSLLPSYGDKLYKQAPMEEVTTEEDEIKWKALTENWKSVNYRDLKEEEDVTDLQRELSCAGNKCEV